MSKPIKKESIREEILKQDYFEKMPKSRRILFVLRTFGPQNFTSLTSLSKMSKSTVSKYLNLHIQNDLVEKRLFNTEFNRKRQKYTLTESGNKISNELFDQYEDDLILINKIDRSISRLSNLIKFYENFSVDETYIKRTIRIISKLGDRFFTLSQNEDLFMSLFFMFLNSARTREFKFELSEFCKQYKVEPYDIEHYINKIMSNNLGFYMFERGEDIFFFHEEDTLGTTTLHLIRDEIIDELIHYSIEGKTRILSLDLIAKEIADELEEMDLIWPKIRIEFELLIEKIFVKMALDLGFPREELKKLILTSKKFKNYGLTLESLINIFNGSENYKDLNIVLSKGI